MSTWNFVNYRVWRECTSVTAHTQLQMARMQAWFGATVTIAIRPVDEILSRAVFHWVKIMFLSANRPLERTPSRHHSLGLIWVKRPNGQGLKSRHLLEGYIVLNDKAFWLVTVRDPALNHPLKCSSRGLVYRTPGTFNWSCKLIFLSQQMLSVSCQLPINMKLEWMFDFI